MQDLRGVSLILLGRMRAPRREIDEFFWRAGVRPRIRVEAHSVGSACGLVASGIGVTLVNELMALDYAHMPVVIRPLEAEMTHNFAFAVAEDVPLGSSAEAFIQRSTEMLKTMLF